MQKKIISFVQTSGLGSQDILSEKPWKLKSKMLESFSHREKGNIWFFFLLINLFMQSGAENIFINSFSIFLSC